MQPREAGGFWLGRGCLVVPKEREEEIRSVLEEEGVTFQQMRIYFPLQEKPG